MKKNLLSAILGAFLSLSIFAILYFLLDKTYLEKFLPQSRTALVVYFPSLIFGPLLALLVHECGHLFAGLIKKQQFKLLVIGFLGIREEAGRIKVYLNKNIAFFGGIAATSPRKNTEINPSDFGFILLAGPVASLIYFILCITIFLKFDNMFNAFFALSGLTSIGIFLATTLPNTSGIMFTDRKRFQRLNSGGVIQEAEVALYKLISTSIIHDSFKHIDLIEIDHVATDKTPIMQFWAAYLRYMYYQDNNCIKEAENSRQQLLQFSDLIPKAMWKSLKIAD